MRTYEDVRHTAAREDEDAEEFERHIAVLEAHGGEPAVVNGRVAWRPGACPSCLCGLNNVTLTLTRISTLTVTACEGCTKGEGKPVFHECADDGWVHEDADVLAVRCPCGHEFGSASYLRD